MNKKTLSLGFIIAIVFAVTAFPTANSVPTGIADPNMVANGCTCHTDGIMASDVVINLTELPENYNVSQVYTFTLKISGGPEPLEGGNQGGFFIAASYGTLESVDNTTQVPEGQTHLTHNAYGNGQREWSFNWTAPESDSKVAVFTVYGNSVNGNAGSSNGAGGDYWNKAEFKVAGVNAKIVVEEEEMSMPQKMVYAFTVLLLTLSAVVVGNRMVVNDQSFEDVMKDYWDAAYPWLTTTDHKYIGTLYIVTGFAFFFIGGILGLLIRLQLFESDNDFLTYEEYNSTFTMHGTTMIFLAAMPIIFGFANYLIPLQLGARDLAFPRLNALSYWLLPTGGIVIYMGYFTGGAGDVGWTGYTPYSSGDTATTPGTDFWVAGQIMLGASSTLTAINFLTTMLPVSYTHLTLPTKA